MIIQPSKEGSQTKLPAFYKPVETCVAGRACKILCACKYKSATHINNSNNEESTSARKGETTQNESETEHIKVEEANTDFLTPEWRAEFNCGRKYDPSYNISPTEVTPVLVSCEHFTKGGCDKSSEEQSRVVVPMMWGMIPFWHKGDYRKHGLSTHNCRLEHMLESKLYRGPFRRGQRCVVLCEGMYEWQTTRSAKPSERAAYLLYMPQGEGMEIYDKTTWQPENVNMLQMAGLFDIWENEDGEKIFSYAIITFESSKIMSWLHHRMPAILETEQQVNDWLDFKRVTDEEALATLRPATQLKWHRVTNLVNNSRNKSDQCNKPIEMVQRPQKPQMNKTMLAWLNVRKRREEFVKSRDTSDDESICNGAGGGGASTTSESEAENPPKRPRFRDFKKIAKAQQNTASASTDSASEKPTVTCKNNSSISKKSDKL